MNYKSEYRAMDAGLLFSITITVFVAAQFFLSFIALIVSELIPSFYKSGYFGWMLQISLYVIFIVAIILYHVIARVNVVKANGLNEKFSFVDFIMSAILGVGVLFTFMIFNYLYTLLLDAIGYKSSSGGVFMPINSIVTFLIATIAMCVFPAVTEEIVFRGAILKGYSKNFKFVPVMFISAVCFMLFHMNPPQFFNTLMLGIVYAIVIKKTKDGKITMVMHFANNFVVVFMTFIVSFIPEDFLGAKTSLLVPSVPDIIQAIVPYVVLFVIGMIISALSLLYFFKRNSKKRYQQSRYRQGNYQQGNFQQGNFQQGNYQQGNYPQDEYQPQAKAPVFDAQIDNNHNMELPFQDAMYYGEVKSPSTQQKVVSLLLALPGVLIAIGYTIFVLLF